MRLELSTTENSTPRGRYVLLENPDAMNVPLQTYAPTMQRLKHIDELLLATTH